MIQRQAIFVREMVLSSIRACEVTSPPNFMSDSGLSPRENSSEHPYVLVGVILCDVQPFHMMQPVDVGSIWCEKIFQMSIPP